MQNEKKKKKICSKCLLSVKDTDSVWKLLTAPQQLINQMLWPINDKNPVTVAAQANPIVSFLPYKTGYLFVYLHTC